MAHALALDYSIEINQSEPVSVQKQSADTRQPLCRFLKREIHFSGKRIDDGTTWKANCKFGTVVAFHVHPGCEPTLVWVLCVWVFAPEFLIIFFL